MLLILDQIPDHQLGEYTDQVASLSIGDHLVSFLMSAWLRGC